MLTVRMLEKRGHAVTVAENGVQALARLEEQPFDLVLMDVQMPEMGGFEATAAIRGRERGSGRHVPILALTARAMIGDRERCLESGMDGYVSKPVRAEELYKAIDEVVRRPHASNGTSPAAAAEPVFDREAALARVDGDAEFLKVLAQTFLDSAPALLADVRAAVAGGDAKKLRAAAHSLKGSACHFGAQAAVEAALRLEQQGDCGELAGADEAVAVLEHGLRSLETELTGFIGSGA
jgi:CheY-like chemotaxis protein